MRQPDFPLATPGDGSTRRGLIAASALLIAMVLSACGSTGQSRSSAEPRGDHGGRMRGYVESSKVTDFCPDPSNRRDDERCIVTRGFDYSRGVTVVRTFDPAGKLINSTDVEGADLSLTDVERARVESLVRVDPRTRDVVNRPGVMLWHGGFVMREPGDKYCDAKSRCIRVVAATHGGDDAILHCVVDLMSDRVVYPNYVPTEKKIVKPLLEQ